MNKKIPDILKISGLSLAIMIINACTIQPESPNGASDVRAKLSALQDDPTLSSRAQLAIKEAEIATLIAESPEKEKALSDHQVFMADRKVEIAIATAQTRLLEDQRKGIIEQRETARLDSRTREANSARKEMQSAQQRNEDLERQLLDLNAKKSNRGMVLTLGDLLFETGKSDLKHGITENLDKLSIFLIENDDRQLIVEGYTDNIGSDSFNLNLSLKRADAVKAYLLDHGVADNRMQTSGKGESAPIASNDTATGRQRNRRVEVIIPDQTTE
ncbi:OmpA family protein [Simiduia litorea]|uniref:OmpA family protein n=1 Tax=Simiduia litorea TaxID=1435348 RepID=UPI0036F1A2EB